MDRGGRGWRIGDVSLALEGCVKCKNWRYSVTRRGGQCRLRFERDAVIVNVRFAPNSVNRNCAFLCADGSQLPVWREIPQHGSDQQERRHVANQMTYLVSVIHCLRCHDAGVHDAGPDGEGD